MFELAPPPGCGREGVGVLLSTQTHGDLDYKVPRSDSAPGCRKVARTVAIGRCGTCSALIAQRRLGGWRPADAGALLVRGWAIGVREIKGDRAMMSHPSISASPISASSRARAALG